MRVLYLTWDGPRESYLEGLFLPILSRLQEHGHSFHVVQFTSAEKEKRLRLAETAGHAGIGYTSFPVPRSTAAATAAMIVLGGGLVRRVALREQAQVIMPRSTIPAAMALRVLGKAPGLQLLFDADGFMPDERVDFSSWSPTSLRYRVLRDIEAQAVRRASSVLVRSRWAGETLLARAGAGTAAGKFAVVRNGRDPGLFCPATAEAAAAVKGEFGMPAQAPLVVYAGSLGGKYLLREMLDFFAMLHRERGDCRLLVLTGELELARSAMAAAGLPAGAVHLKQVLPAQVPGYLAAADLGLALIAQTFSMRGVSPIKLGEYLLCGVPALCSAGVGEADQQLDGELSGRTLPGFGADSLRQGVDWFLGTVLPNRERCRESARSAGLAYFTHDAAVESYLAALAACARN